MWQRLWLSVLILCAMQLTLCLPFESPRITEFGLEHDEVIKERNLYELTLAKHSTNETYYGQQFVSTDNGTEVCVQIDRNSLRLLDNVNLAEIDCLLSYTSAVPLLVSYDLDSVQAADLTNRSWYWLPATTNATLPITVHAVSKQIGLSYLRFWIREAKPLNYSHFRTWNFSHGTEYSKTIASSPSVFNSTEILGFPLVIIRGKGAVQLVFHIVVVTMVTLFTFTMGCELDPQLLKSYSRRPVVPAIGFGCQFIIMPLISFAIAKLVPIKREFAFGLLTIGCSPGGGASNAWSLMLGGDINLSILMTFISSFSALFMMPLLLFIFGRFFVDVNRVRIPYANICIQLLQIALPALAGLGLRFWKPRIAIVFTKFTRPMFIFFIIFFLTFGIYANLSIIKLIASYPIVIPISALLPWLGFCLAGLVAFILRRPRPVVITVAIETGIQNVGASILVLLYSMPQPAGDLGAVMPITVSMFTPVPLYFILLGVTIRRRCCNKPAPSEIQEVQKLKETKETEMNDVATMKMLNGDNPIKAVSTENDDYNCSTRM